jgi:glutathione synthase/RimK-type ligase-like ATP-grasp enzyme
MSPTRSSRPSFVVVGNPGCPRVAGFQQTLARCDLPPAGLVPWADVITGRAALNHAGSIVRLESPGRDWDVEKLLLAEGADEPDEAGPSCIGRDEALGLTFDRGRIWFPRQWYRGFRAVLRRLPALPVVTNPPADVEVLFDKQRCQERFAAAGIPVPLGLGRVRCVDELRQRMREAACRSAFVKLLHGSSASGVVAYRTDGARQEAATTVEMVREGGELKLYNSRLIRSYHEPGEVARLIDTLAREGVRAEEWLPKATLDDHVFDLRVLVIAGKARHAVVRMSRSPMTNLHLGNRRGDLAAVVARMGEKAWGDALRTCERAAAVFPGSLHVGVDLLVGPDWKRHAVLEANAFGDLLPGVLCDGMDTYEAEVRAVMNLRGQ